MNNKFKFSFWGVLVFCIAIFMIMCLTPVLYSHWAEHIVNGCGIGVFGDSAGIMNAAFSALAFFAVTYTFWIQNGKDDQKARLSRKAQFELAFFHMTATLENIVSHLEYKEAEAWNDTAEMDVDSNALYSRQFVSPYGNNGNGLRHEGRAIFKYLYIERRGVTKCMKEYIEDGHSIDDLNNTVFDGTLDHYFRYLYRILKYVDESDLITEDERYGYTAILRAQISVYELLVLFFNGLTENGRPKFKPLIEKYAFFNNLRTDLLPESGEVHYSEKYTQKKIYERYEEPLDFDSGKEYSKYAFRHKPVRKKRSRTLKCRNVSFTLTVQKK